MHKAKRSIEVEGRRHIQVVKRPSPLTLCRQGTRLHAVQGLGERQVTATNTVPGGPGRQQIGRGDSYLLLLQTSRNLKSGRVRGPVSLLREITRHDAVNLTDRKNKIMKNS